MHVKYAPVYSTKILLIAGDVELLELKRRLLETEAQMARILEAMEAVQQKVGSTVAAAASEVLVKVRAGWIYVFHSLSL